MRYSGIGLKIIVLLCLSPVWLQAQETPLLINAEARLETVLQLNMTQNNYVEFGVKKINEDLYQITKQPEDVMFSIESTGNWNLAISADDLYFRGVNDSTLKIPVDFVGLYIENRGENWDNGLFSNIANATKDTVIYLNAERTMLLASGLRGNVGGVDQNSFILRWKFFYEDEGLKLAKFAGFDIEDDNYQVGFTITLSESAPYGQMDK